MDFKNVDNKFRPIPFQSWNEKLETEETSRQIKEMYGAGIGENEIEITLLNNLRNMQGPFHLSEGECYKVVPASFYKEECVWFRNPNGDAETRWNDNYCFTNISVKNKL